MSKTPSNEFEKAATEQSSGNILWEFWDFLRVNKKWWLLPILLVLSLMGVLVFLSTSAAAPFIYTLF
jgi:hypothetical protein